MISIMSIYAPQTGLDKREKEFYAKVGDMMETIEKTDMVILGGDWNGHVGDKPEIFGDHGVHGGKGFGRQNLDGLRLLERSAIRSGGAEYHVCEERDSSADILLR